MTTFSYDFTDAGEYGDYVTLTPARYIFAFTKVERAESKAGNPKAVVTLQVVAGGPEIYVDGLITQHWNTTGKGSGRFKSFLNALGIKPKDRGKVNLAQYYGEEIGAIVELQPGDDLRDDGSEMMFHNLKAIGPGSQYRQVLGLDDEGAEDDDEPEEDVGVEGDEDEEDEDGQEWAEDDFEGLGLKELKEIAEVNDISTDPAEGKTKLSVAAMKARLIAELVGEADEDDDEEEEGEEGEEGEEWTVEDIDALTLEELRGLAEEWEVSIKPARGRKVASAALLRSRLKVALEADEGEDEEEGEEDPF